MNPIDSPSAVIRAAKNVPVGSLVCFRMQSGNYKVKSVETKDKPFPQVIHRSGREDSFNSYSPDDRLWVILP